MGLVKLYLEASKLVKLSAYYFTLSTLFMIAPTSSDYLTIRVILPIPKLRYVIVYPTIIIYLPYHPSYSFSLSLVHTAFAGNFVTMEKDHRQPDGLAHGYQPNPPVI